MSTPLPPFPYHPKGNVVTSPQNQIYWTLRSEGPLSWKETQSLIAQYLREFEKKQVVIFHLLKNMMLPYKNCLKRT